MPTLFRPFRFSFSAAFLLGLVQLPDTVRAQHAPALDPPVFEPKTPSSPAKRTGTASGDTPTAEWTLHKSADGTRPNGTEQAMLWLMNRARSHPSAEGIFLSDTGDVVVESSVSAFDVDLEIMRTEFEAISPRPPAAFDRRLHAGSVAHALDLIKRDAQDHNGQFDRATEAGFQFNGAAASVFSYARNPLHAHAAFNIDWGPDGGAGDGMQVGRGHRVGLMDKNSIPLSNVGIAVVPDPDTNNAVGPMVVSIVYARARADAPNHFNKFIVGTVWVDLNGNRLYDENEGLGAVTVVPDRGTWFAITGEAGGYAIPVSEDGVYELTFTGGELESPVFRQVTVAGESVLLAWDPADAYGTLAPETPLLSFSPVATGLRGSWQALPGDVDQLESSSNLLDWSLDERPIKTEGGVRSFLLQPNEIGDGRFFRVRRTSAP